MTESLWPRTLFVIACCAAVLLLLRVPTALGAAPGEVSVVRGHRLALAWCSGCHAVGKFALPIDRRRAQAFTAIANKRSTTPLAIKVFLQSSHEPMPNFILNKKQDIDDLAAYIVSLKR